MRLSSGSTFSMSVGKFDEHWALRRLADVCRCRGHGDLGGGRECVQ